MCYDDFTRHAVMDNWIRERLQNNLAKIEPPEMVKARIMKRAKRIETMKKRRTLLFKWYRGSHRDISIQSGAIADENPF